MLVTARWFCWGVWHTLAKTSVMFKESEWKMGGKKCQFLPNLSHVQNWCKCYCRALSLQRPHTLTALVRRKEGSFSKVVRNTDTKPQITQQSVRHVAVQNPARTQETWRCAHFHPWSCSHTSAQSPALIWGTHSSGFAALSTAPTQSCFGAQQPSWEALGFQKRWAHPRSTWEGHGATLLCLSWRGHQTCTPQDVNTTSESLRALLRAPHSSSEGWWGLAARRLQCLGFRFNFFQPSE